jgi:hypothetical protein
MLSQDPRLELPAGRLIDAGLCVMGGIAERRRMPLRAVLVVVFLTWPVLRGISPEMAIVKRCAL